MKLEALQQALLFDFYGDLLTEKQRTCFDLYFNQDLSLGEIAQMEGISRQGVHDTLARAEAVLQDMEDKTGCVQRALHIRKSLEQIEDAANRLLSFPDEQIRILACRILTAAETIKE